MESEIGILRSPPPKFPSAGQRILPSLRKALQLSKTLFLIDGRYQIYRGHFGMRPLTNSEGMQVQAVYAVTDLLLRL